MRRWIRPLVVAGLLVVTATSSLPAAPPASSLPATDAALWGAMGVSLPTRPLAAPDFTLSDLAERPVGLKDLRGRVVILYFWTTW